MEYTQDLMVLCPPESSFLILKMSLRVGKRERGFLAVNNTETIKQLICILCSHGQS